MTELGPAAPMLTFEQIMAQYGGAINECTKVSQDPQVESERILFVNEGRRNWNMVRGNHFLIPGMVNTQYGQIADYMVVDAASIASESGADIKFCHPINLIGGDCYKFVALMSQSPPRVKAVADDSENQKQLDDASNANTCIRDLWIKCKIDEIMPVVAFHQYTTGPAYLRARWVLNGKKNGVSTQPNIQISDDGTGRPAPQEVGPPISYENGDVEIEVLSILEVSHTFGAKELSKCPTFVIERMMSKWELLAAFAGKDGKPGPLEQYRESDPPDDEMTSASVTAQEAIGSVQHPSGLGTARPSNMWRFREIWIQPYILEAIKEAEPRELFKKHFPKGLYIAKVGGITVQIDNRDVTDEVSVVKVGRGEKILERPLAGDAVPYQRATNDLGNLGLETVLRGVSRTIIDSELLDRDAMRQNEAVPAELILTSMPVDGDLNKRIASIPQAKMSDQLVPFMQLIRTLWQDTTGIRPELSGGGAPSQTYREARQRKEQAQMQLAPQARCILRGFERWAEIATRLRAKCGSGTIKVTSPGAFGSETSVVDMASLAESGWHAEADDNFPMNESERSDRMWALLKEYPPEVQQQLSVLDPLNLEQTVDLLQIPGYQSALKDQKVKTLADIAQLLNGAPVDGPPGPNGEVGPQQPPIQPDNYDDHVFVADFLKKWMRSKTGQKQKAMNTPGFAGVELFQQAHEQMAQPPEPPPPPLVRSNLALSARLEDMPPGMIQEVMQGAGLPGAQVPAMGLQPAQDQPPVPPPVDAEPAQENPLPGDGSPPPGPNRDQLPPLLQ